MLIKVVIQCQFVIFQFMQSSQHNVTTSDQHIHPHSELADVGNVNKTIATANVSYLASIVHERQQ